MDITDLFSYVFAAILTILFFGGSIFVHELGHFLAAKYRGLRIERFSIGFGPKIFSWVGKDRVEYRLSWLPLGGYVALPELADMSAIEGKSDSAAAATPPPSYTTKLIVLTAGAAFNVIFAFLLACIVWKIGEPTSSALSTSTVAEVVDTLKTADGREVPSPASVAGLKAGDVILKVDGKPVQWFGEIVERLALSDGWTKDGQRETIFTIRRDGQIQELKINPVISGPEKLRMVGFSPVSQMVIASPTPESLAARSGLREDDQIVAVNGTPVLTIHRLIQALKAAAGAPYTLTVLRAGVEQIIPISATSPKDKNTDLGIELKSGVIFTHPSPWEQISRSANKTLESMAKLVSPRSDLGLSHLTSPIGIISNFFELAKQGLPFVLWFTILVNVNLAIFNLMPIPVLDGGHILFATIAKLRGKALPPQLVAGAQSIFMVLLLSVMLYVLFFDAKRIHRNYAAEKPAPAQSAQSPSTEPAPAKP
jgi:regulator of sigma E protease